MKPSSVSVICTVFNEEKTIQKLLDALRLQTVAPAEIIVCDGVSSDKTSEIIATYSKKYPSMHLRLLVKKGNRSVGRNAALSVAKSKLVAITDAGCEPEKKWLQELRAVHEKSQAPVVAGYYKGLAQTPFEEAVVPYVLVMPDRVNPKNFLPATRSMLIEKKVWQELGGFDEALSHNEDYAFARKIRAAGYQIAFAADALVKWFPRKNLAEFENMIARFAKGDIQARIIRPKVMVLFIRYVVLFLILVVTAFTLGWREVIALLLALFVLYSLWALWKNGKYVSKGWYWLPILQFVADYSVIKGSVQGLKKN